MCGESEESEECSELVRERPLPNIGMGKGKTIYIFIVTDSTFQKAAKKKLGPRGARVKEVVPTQMCRPKEGLKAQTLPVSSQGAESKDDWSDGKDDWGWGAAEIEQGDSNP